MKTFFTYDEKVKLTIFQIYFFQYLIKVETYVNKRVSNPNYFLMPHAKMCVKIALNLGIQLYRHSDAKLRR